MSNELVKNDTGALVQVDQKYGDDVFGEVSSSGKWLPYITLFGVNAGEVAEDKIRAGNHGVKTGKNLTDLGSEFDCLVVAFRPKTMDLSGDSIITVYDHKSDEFKRIAAQSDVKDSNCMYGPEFLLWLPSLQKWATYFCSNKTSRRAAPDLRTQMGKAATVKSILIKTAKYKWFGPVFTSCSTPFALPSDESLAEEVEKFNNPPANDVEKAPETSGGRAR